MFADEDTSVFKGLSVGIRGPPETPGDVGAVPNDVGWSSVVDEVEGIAAKSFESSCEIGGVTDGEAMVS